MAGFEARLENAGSAVDPRFRVFITHGDGGFSKCGREAIPSCASHGDLGEQIHSLPLSLDADCQGAGAMLTGDARNSAAVFNPCATP